MTNPDTTEFTIATANSKGWIKAEDINMPDWEQAMRFLSSLPTQYDQDRKEEKMKKHVLKMRSIR